MALLYKNAKKEVDREFDQIKAMGYTPQANEDGKTYSWVNDKGEIYRGKLNPTPGIDADSGFLKRHLTREARQNRLMSEKVTAMIPRQGAKPSGGSSSSGAEIKAPTTKPKIEEKAPEVPVKDTGPTKTPTSQLIAGVTAPQIEAGKTLRKTINTGKPKTLPTTKSYVPPKYEAGKVNRTEPYLYYEQTEYQKENNLVQRFWRNKYSGTTAQEIKDEKAGRTKSIFAGEMVSPGISRTIEEGGKKYVLAKNPDFEQGLYSTDAVSLSEAEAASNETGLMGTLRPDDYASRSLEIVKRPDGQYVKVGKKASDVVGNILTGTQALLMPKKPGYLGTTMPAVWKGAGQAAKTAKVAEEAVTGPVTLIPKAQSALKTAQTATTSIGPAGGSKLALSGLANKFAIGPAKLIPQGTEMATTTWNAATNPYRFILKAPKALGPGYKCGGKLKLMPKKAKGKGK